MPGTRTLPLWAGRSLALIGIVLVALNLRTAVTAISPIVHAVSTDIPLSAVGLSIIGMLPPVAFAVAGIAGAAIAKRLGLEWFLSLAVVGMIVGHLVRALAAEYSMFFIGSALALFGMGIGNVLLPPLVKRYFPDRVGLVTAAYVTIMSIGSAAPPMLAAPVAHVAGWRVSVGMWALVALIALVPWLVVLIRNRRERLALASRAMPAETPPAQLVHGVWHSKTAWFVAIAFAVTSFNAYSMFAWLPEILITTAGQTPAQAGVLLGYYASVGIPLALVTPVVAARMSNVGLLIELGALLLILGNLGLLIMPATVPWLSVTLIGCGQIIFPVCLVLINLRARTPFGSVTLSGFSQSFSYAIAALGPLAIGLIFEWTGSWSGAYVLLLGSAVAAAIAGHMLRKPHFVEDEVTAWAQRRTAMAAESAGR